MPSVAAYPSPAYNGSSSSPGVVGPASSPVTRTDLEALCDKLESARAKALRAVQDQGSRLADSSSSAAVANLNKLQASIKDMRTRLLPMVLAGTFTPSKFAERGQLYADEIAENAGIAADSGVLAEIAFVGKGTVVDTAKVVAKTTVAVGEAALSAADAVSKYPKLIIGGVLGLAVLVFVFPYVAPLLRGRG